MISDIINLNMHIRQSVKKTKRLASHRYNNILLQLLVIMMMYLLNVYYPLVNKQPLNKNRSKIMKHFFTLHLPALNPRQNFCCCQRASG